jgi:hypothetical protein
MSFILPFSLREEPENAPSFQTLMEEDFGMAFELICLVSNIRKKFCGVLDIFLSFLKKIDERKTHNMSTLMLNPRF